MWLEMRMLTPPAASSLRRRAISCRPMGSRPFIGSSSTSRSGSCNRPWASFTRCFMPLENWPMRLDQCSRGQSDLVQYRFAAARRGFAVQAGQAARPRQPIQRAQVLGHGLALGTETDALDEPRVVPGHLAENRERPGTGLKLAGDDLDEGALARAIGADQSGQAGADVEADVVQPHDHAVPAAQFAGLDDGAHSGLTRSGDGPRSQAQHQQQGHRGAARVAAYSRPPSFAGRMLLQHRRRKWGRCPGRVLRSSPSRKTRQRDLVEVEIETQVAGARAGCGRRSGPTTPPRIHQMNQKAVVDFSLAKGPRRPAPAGSGCTCCSSP